MNALILPNDPHEALRDLASYMRTISIEPSRAVHDCRDLEGYWQTTDWLEGLLELADEADRIAGLRTVTPPSAGVMTAAPATQKGVCPKCGGQNISDLGPEQQLFKRYKCLTCLTLHGELAQPEATYGGVVSVQELDPHDVAAAILKAKP